MTPRTQPEPEYPIVEDKLKKIADLIEKGFPSGSEKERFEFYNMYREICSHPHTAAALAPKWLHELIKDDSTPITSTNCLIYSRSGAQNQTGINCDGCSPICQTCLSEMAAFCSDCDRVSSKVSTIRNHDAAIAKAERERVLDVIEGLIDIDAYEDNGVICIDPERLLEDIKSLREQGAQQNK
jgi:hypothetical protein